MRRAEVSLLIIIELQQCIPGELRDRNSPDNPYCRLVHQLLEHNFLEYDCHITTNHFFEVIVRYAEFFKENENFLATVVNWFFSSQGIRNPTKAISSQAVNLFLRLTEKFRHLPIFPPQS